MTATPEYRVLWTGSRKGWPRAFVEMIAGTVLNHVRMRQHAGENIKAQWGHGGAMGVDTAVSGIARNYKIEETEWIPDWEQYGKRAGILRNEKMVDEFKPHLGIGLNWNNSAGTRHCVSYMKAKGIPVLSIEYTGDPEGKFFPF